MRTNENFNSDYIRGLAILMAVGLILIVGYIFLNNHFRSKEYPDLTFTDTLQGERVSSFETNHAILYVDFRDGRKHTLDCRENSNYEDYTTIVSILSTGDIVSKKANSDTIVISHSGKDYFYILGQVKCLSSRAIKLFLEKLFHVK
jgi:hypothetical protein